MASVGNDVQPSVDVPNPRPASVRALTNSLCRTLIYSISPSVFQLPDELILSILTYVSSNPELTGPYARFRLAYCVEVSGCCSQRVGFLRPLSMTCRAMRFRFVPWVWERLELPGWTSPQKMLAKNLSVVVDAFHADMFLATCVKYFCVLPFPRVGADSRPPKVHEGPFPAV